MALTFGVVSGQYTLLCAFRRASGCRQVKLIMQRDSSHHSTLGILAYTTILHHLPASIRTTFRLFVMSCAVQSIALPSTPSPAGSGTFQAVPRVVTSFSMAACCTLLSLYLAASLTTGGGGEGLNPNPNPTLQNSSHRPQVSMFAFVASLYMNNTLLQFPTIL